MLQKIITYALLITFTLSLASCTTTHLLGDGIVIAAESLHEKDYSPGDKTKAGLKLGGTIGVVNGGIIGGLIGFVGGVFSGTTSGLLIGTIGGGVIGAGLFGLVGGAVGGGIGYAVDLAVQNRSEYEFKVQTVNGEKTLTVIQYSNAIPLQTRVRILEKNGNIFIRKN